jgi:DNA-binding MarR family transcriptional regulator
MAARSGYELPLLLASAFRALVDELHEELARQGHPGVRPIHGFGLQALGPDGVSISELGRRLGVSKQAAAKTAAALEGLGYASRMPHPLDKRASVLVRTERGEEMLGLSAAVFSQLRQRWAERLGDSRVQALEDDLEAVVTVAGGAKLGDLPGWLH